MRDKKPTPRLPAGGMQLACVLALAACVSPPPEIPLHEEPAAIAEKAVEKPSIPPAPEAPEIPGLGKPAFGRPAGEPVVANQPRVDRPESSVFARRDPARSDAVAMREPAAPPERAAEETAPPAAAPPDKPVMAAPSPEKAPREERPKAQALKPVQPSEQPKPAAVPASPAMEGSPGREFSVQLPGSGWIYLADRDPARRLELVRKTNESSQTTFIFLTWQPGEYILKFQQQNLAANLVRNTSRNVTVRQAAVPARGQVKGGPEQPSNAEDPNPLPAARPPADPRAEEIARVEAALQAGNADDPDRDRLLFVLAALYEAESPKKDVKKAISLYQTIVDKYKLSPYYRDAWARTQFLTRQYFDVR